MSKKTEFLYLSEPDLINVGVLDIKNSVEVAEDVFKLLSKGDYLMGGSNANSHGMGIVFPKTSPFPNMPVAGPDRRFVAMPAYLGGEYDICGNKWYGSNAENKQKGLPRSVLTLMLNDKDTGEPLSLMSANLISASRTGAIPGVATKYLAKSDSAVCAVIGCGPINQVCFEAIASQAANLNKAIFYNRSIEKAQQLAKWCTDELGIDGVVSTNLEETIRQADIITIAVSRTAPLNLENSWFKEGALILFSGPGSADEDFWKNNKIIYDNYKLHEAYVEEAIQSGDKQAYYNGVIGGPIYKLIDEGKIASLKDSTSMGEIILGEKQGRVSDSEKIIFVSCGMAVFDVALGFNLYQKALENRVGQNLLLWESSLQS
ncbi:tyramine oxidase subunit B [Psychrobacillus lasiicapitis]|uniref:Ornithine cyclodeaminase n=1 Tax=Psychrobacillus lasiicapitis TaxID=1636719 RepID=A0A544TGN3_9BACI|nr:tyramine oxidase subunit B [Psychrobacillus lasiicapitis]TQR16625.1 ornithine cyclodeaminase [Psychrobacillus lasiicapitis]GGA28573.1 ornithine cyclodeaminase [Psychrobacillus lasiicapitis]